MQYVEVSPTPEGYWYDPRPYLEALTDLAERLPPGARAWATDPLHYDFSSSRCIKDLWLSAAFVQPELVVRLDPSQSKHEHGLEVRYVNVASFDLAAQQATGSPRPSVQLDEVVPHELGCRHEIDFHGGRLTVVAADLNVEWLD